jgi:hypothetical protein
MSDIMHEFPHLAAKTLGELHHRYQQLKEGPKTGPNNGLSDDVLQELIAISRVLRKRSSAPVAKTSKKAAAPTLDAL